jgi:hypothetical protein
MFEKQRKQRQQSCCRHIFFSIVLNVNKAMATSCRHLFLSFFLLEGKMGDGSKLTIVTFFFFCCCYCEQGDNNKLVAITHFFFFLLEAKMGNNNKFTTVTFYFSFVVIVMNKATATNLLSSPFFFLST